MNGFATFLLCLSLLVCVYGSGGLRLKAPAPPLLFFTMITALHLFLRVLAGNYPARFICFGWRAAASGLRLCCEGRFGMMEARLLDRLAGWLIRAAEEIEHFNKSGFNIYLQVNTREKKKRQSGIIVEAACVDFTEASCLSDNLASKNKTETRL